MWDVGFVKGECSEKENKRQFRIKSVTLVLIRDALRYQGGGNFNLTLPDKANCYCQSCFVKNIPSSEVNESPTNDQIQSRNSRPNITVTLNSNKRDFYNS